MLTKDYTLTMIGERIYQELISKKGLPIKFLADEVGVDISTLPNLKEGQVVNVLFKVCTFLRVSPEQLLS